MCQNVEDSFQAGEKTSAVFLDLTAAYDSVAAQPPHEASGDHPRQAHGGVGNGDVFQPQLPATHQKQ